MYAAAVVLVLLSVALLVIWFAAEEHGRVVEETEEAEERPRLRVPAFAPGEAAFLPLVVASLDAVRSHMPKMGCTCRKDGADDCDVLSRVKRVHYAGEVLYAQVSRCQSCQTAATRYFRLLTAESDVAATEAAAAE